MLIRRFLPPLTAFALAAALFVSAGQTNVIAQTPAPTGQIAVQATLQAGPGAAARTWRFELLNASGSVLQTLSLGTSGAAPTATQASEALPYGSYTVRQILGNDTRTACDAASFYEVISPAGAQATVQLGAARVTVPFTIHPCPALPTNPQLVAPIDTVAPGAPPPIDKVLGERSPGPNAPLAPNTGNGQPRRPASPGPATLLILLGLGATLIPPAGFAVAYARQRSRR